MIETISDLLPLLHRLPGSTRIKVGYNLDEFGKLTGQTITDADEVVFLIHQPPVIDDGVADPHAKAVDDALELCDRILSLCEEVPERGEDFASGVSETVESIRESIENSDHVTEKQLIALQNMERGVERWLN